MNKVHTNQMFIGESYVFPHTAHVESMAVFERDAVPLPAATAGADDAASDMQPDAQCDARSDQPVR